MVTFKSVLNTCNSVKTTAHSLTKENRVCNSTSIMTIFENDNYEYD